MENKIIKIEGLTKMDIINLKDQVRGINLREEEIEETEETEDQFNEPISTTTILIQLTPHIIGLLGLWLSKATEKKKRKISYKRVNADGSTIELHLEEEMAKSGESSDKALKVVLEKALEDTAK